MQKNKAAVAAAFEGIQAPNLKDFASPQLNKYDSNSPKLLGLPSERAYHQKKISQLLEPSPVHQKTPVSARNIVSLEALSHIRQLAL